MALYNLDNEFDLAKFDKAVAQARQKGGWVELRRKHPQRTLKQNAYLHVLLGYYGAEFGYSIDEVKYKFFKKECNHELFLIRRKGNRGEEHDTYRSTSSLTTEEMTLAIDRFRAWSSSVCHHYLPEPNESGLLMYAQQQIDKNQEFL